MATTPRIALALVVFALIVGCEGSGKLLGSVTKEQVEERALEALGEEIELLIRDKTCVIDTDCRSIGFGAKPCGGHWSYLVYSTRTVDPAAVQAAVAEYNRTNHELNEERGWHSDCSMALPTPIACLNEICAELR
jgi:hypothetical protein